MTVYARARVNRTGAQADRASELESLKAFASTIDRKMAERQEERAAAAASEMAVDTCVALFDEDAPASGKQVQRLNIQLQLAKEALVEAKASDARLMATNEALAFRVSELETANRKLLALAKHLKAYEREANEMRYLLQGFYAQ